MIVLCPYEHIFAGEHILPTTGQEGKKGGYM
jgi:hypothetical protein